MFRPYVKQRKILLFVAVINLLLVYIAYNSSSYEKSIDYVLKQKASEIMRGALDDTYSLNSSIDSLELDKFKSGLIGVDSTDSKMTTKKGFLDSKRAVTNPNFAAIFVDWFTELGLPSNNPSMGDTIAVSLTGSFPGANIALLSACKAADIYPVIISSIGSSSWGANELDKTWIDIENYLNDRKYFSYESIAYSLGGDNDSLDELDIEVKNILINRIKDKANFLIKGNSIKESISKRIDMYNSKSSNYKAYINIGGASASLGDSTTSKMYLPGLIYGKDEAIADAFDEEYEAKYEYLEEIVPVIEYFLNNKKIPVINIRNINNLCAWYNLPYKEEEYTEENMKVGSGILFGIRTPHHLLVVWICTLASFSLICWLAISSIIQVNNKMKEIDNESII